ncbi:uncharacterized protein LOC126108904 isoform X2 [Schistocerca cancellata]|uniref:uncharacterized protein LOC126108904 isoform X2 n=1 Tax=Schistocerca cancellata TaxID=274614 RepID=UPI002117B43D|nr:uncharacterized protein LOC126108904 isoform X2 [Schistocerca cancellata]
MVWVCSHERNAVEDCRAEAMDQEPTMWIKKEETNDVPTELGPMFVEDVLELSWSTDIVKEDPEVNVEVNVTENIMATSTRYACNSGRLIQHTGGSCGISFEETLHHGLVKNELEMRTHRCCTHHSRSRYVWDILLI